MLQKLRKTSDQARLSVVLNFQENLGRLLSEAATKARSISVNLHLGQMPDRSEVEELIQFITASNQTLDRLIRQNLDMDIQQNSLVEALSALLTQNRQASRMQCRLRQVGPAPMVPASVLSHACIMVNECLGLSRRRGASFLILHIENDGESILIEIQDNAPPPGTQFAEILEMLHLHAALAGAHLSISPAPPNHCKTCVRLPGSSI